MEQSVLTYLLYLFSLNIPFGLLKDFSLLFIALFDIVLKLHCNCLLTVSGDKGIRTLDPLLARQVLSQLSYTPMLLFLSSFSLHAYFLMGSRGLEPPTSRLSGVRSNQLSYDPLITRFLFV